jgi:hypothetical protein
MRSNVSGLRLRTDLEMLRQAKQHQANSPEKATVSIRLSAAAMSVADAMRTKKVLFLVVLGGRTRQSHVELHDVRWVAGERIDDTFSELKLQWFGSRRGLHIDSYVAMHCVDGYAIELKRVGQRQSKPPFSPAGAVKQRLWFVNMGAYEAHSLQELHHCGCVVAPTAEAAKSRARQRWLCGALQQHKDDLHAIDQLGGVDDCLPIDDLQGWQVHLVPAPNQTSCSFQPDWVGYKPI